MGDTGGRRTLQRGALLATLALVAAQLFGLGLAAMKTAPGAGSAATHSAGGTGHARAGFASSAVGTTSGAGRMDVASIARGVDPALVDIYAGSSRTGTTAAGTGIVLTPDGRVLTNYHVIADASTISVVDVGNGRTYDAGVLGYDRQQDIAVLALDGASGLVTARLGGSSGLSLGQPVVAIGNAGGVGGTPASAAGAITSLHESVIAEDRLHGSTEYLSGLIATSADVRLGDSGGPLVDNAGRVVAVDVATTRDSTAASSGTLGFAIPIGQALSVAGQITAASQVTGLRP